MKRIVLCLFIISYAHAQEVTVGFMGDVMLGRSVNDHLIKNKNYSYPWGNLLPLLQSTDFNVANLETTLSMHGKPVVKKFNFRSHPQNVEALKQANIKLVSLANNHSFDFGKQGFYETRQALTRAGIKAIGAGSNLYEAQRAAFIKEKGMTFAFLALTDNEPTWAAQKNKAGIHHKEIESETAHALAHYIATLKKNADFVIVSIHWGPNWPEKPSYTFQKFAHKLIDYGVDLIHGHSPHIFQGIELYKKKLIIYSAGDFVDDYAIDTTLRNDQSFLFLVTFAKDRLQEVHLIPTLIKNLQVIKAPQQQSREMLLRMKKLSLDLGTVIPNNGVVSINSQ